MPENNFVNMQSRVVLDRNGDILKVYPTLKGQFCLPENNNVQIPLKLEKALLLFEDKNFYHHLGFDPFSILRAVKQNLEKGKVVSGASTITMQLARLMKDKPRTFYSKIIELFQAIRFETKYSKSQILRKYLTYCPYGGNIIGYETASIRYFRKKSSELTWAEAATLAILPNAPGLIHPEKNRTALILKRNRLLKRMYNEKIISENEYTIAIAEKIPDMAYPFESIALHASQYLTENNSNKIIKSTISKEIQSKTEKLIRNFASFDINTKISTVSAIMLDNKSSEIITYLGSHDFFDEYTKGQVDGITAYRAVGGMLHPFIYALAIENKFISPDTEISDTLFEQENYVIENDDNFYMKSISAESALRKLRKTPAARVLKKISPAEFYLFLKNTGVKRFNNPPEWYGFSFASGTVDMRLKDIALLYSGLAQDGTFSKPCMNYCKTESIKLISNKTSLTIKTMLGKKKGDNQTIVISDINKTGKDIWLVAINNDFTIALRGSYLFGPPEDVNSDKKILKKIAFNMLSFLK